MADLVRDAEQQIHDLVLGALGALVAEGRYPAAPAPAFTTEIPADTAHGDFATNIAMVSGKLFKEAGLPFNPRALAAAVCEKLHLGGSYFERVEIAGPGFINFFLDGRWFADVVDCVLESGSQYGRTDYGRGQKVMVEFVSANPTGPMHMGNARGGALGDCLAAALDAAGYDVAREFYINDAGNQIEKFGCSLEARYLQLYRGEDAVPFPEDGYQGADITARAREYAEINGDKLLNVPCEERRQALVDYALPLNIAAMQDVLGRYRIEYDVWFRESELHRSGLVQKVIGMLTERGYTYEKEGAVWYKNAEVLAAQYRREGKTEEQIAQLELKDDVLVRQNGNPTYFAADIAYHYNKFVTRGFDRVINVWGADHHGHVARLKGAMDALGLDGHRLDIVLMQLVRLMKDGQPFKMSKRTGKAITLVDLIDEVPVDAARFFFNLRDPASTLDFDLDLAVTQSSQNPVYYVQYAHARICSILKNLQAEGIAPRACRRDEYLQLITPEEVELIRTISKYPGEIVDAAKNYDPARLTRYAVDLATAFHKFYNACRVKCEADSLCQARLGLCIATRTVVRNVLDLLKISAPEVM